MAELTPAQIIEKINAWVTTNGDKQNTGAHLNVILNAIMEYVGVGFAFRGTAPASAPSPDVPSAYLAAPGTYTNYESGDTVIPEGSIAVLKYDGSAWSKNVIKVCDPVSVSQNTNTGHTEINVGSTTTPVASTNDVDILNKTILNGASISSCYELGLIDSTTHLPVYPENSKNRHTPFIPVSIGDIVFAQVLATTGFNAISLYKTDSFDSYIDGVAGSGDKNYYYEVKESGYVVIGHFQETNAKDGIYLINKKEQYELELKTGNSININQSVASPATAFIFNGKAGTIKISVSNFNGTTYWINFWDSAFVNLGYIEILATGDYEFTAIRDVAIITIGTSGTSTNIDVTFSSDATLVDGLLDVDGVAENYPLLTSGNLSNSHKFGLIDATTHKPVYPDNHNNWYSPFIKVSRGDRIYARVYASTGFMAISMYGDLSFDNYIGGVNGSANGYQNYFYEAETDGYIVIASYSGDSPTDMFLIDKKHIYETEVQLKNSLTIKQTLGDITQFFVFNAKSGGIRINVNSFSGSSYWVNFFDKNFSLLGYIECNATGEQTFNNNSDVAVISIGCAPNTTSDADVTLYSDVDIMDMYIPYYPTKRESKLPFKTFAKVADLIDSDDVPSSDYRCVYAGLGYSVVWDDTNSRYVMLSAGYNGIKTQVGMSYSTDLITWTDYGVVLAPTEQQGDPDSGGITFPQMLKYRDKWLVYYIGYDEEGFEQGKHTICYAITEDFINFTRGGKILDVQSFIDDGIWDVSKLNTGVIYRPNVVNVYGKYYMFINGGPDGDALPQGPYENIYVAVSDNPITGWKVMDKVFDAQEIYGDTGWLCSDPDVITNGRDFFMMFWGNGNLYSASANANEFPLNWHYNGLQTSGLMRPLLIPTKDYLYMIVNSRGAYATAIYRAEWNI